MTVEMLVRRVDKINKNSDVENAQCTKRGDVIVVKAVGWQWSDIERNNPEWVVLIIEGMTVGDGEAFLQREQPISAAEAQPLLKKRMISLDLDFLTMNIDSKEQANDNATWNKPFNYNQQHIINATRVKPSAAVVLV